MEHQSGETNPSVTEPPAPGWWLARDDNWYPPERHPDYRPPTAAADAETEPPHQVQATIAAPATVPESPGLSIVESPQIGFNTVFEVHWKGGWPGFFSGESQTKAMTRALAQLNGEGWRVSAAVTDRWSFFKRVGKALLALVTLGFVVHHENVILIVERIS